MKELQLDSFESPIGTVIIVADAHQLCSLDFADCEQRMVTLLQRRYGPVHLAQTPDPYGFSSRIRAYFAGDYSCLDDIPVNTVGTSFQQRVWSVLRTIPAGTTTTYGDLAARLDKPTASLAVWEVNALNTVGMIHP